MLEGNVVEIEATFSNSRGRLIDPDIVILRYTSPSASGELTYGEDAIERLRTGRYIGYVYLDAPGEWIFQWEADGITRGLGEKVVRVSPRKIADAST